MEEMPDKVREEKNMSICPRRGGGERGKGKETLSRLQFLVCVSLSLSQKWRRRRRRRRRNP